MVNSTSESSFSSSLSPWERAGVRARGKEGKGDGLAKAIECGLDAHVRLIRIAECGVIPPPLTVAFGTCPWKFVISIRPSRCQA